MLGDYKKILKARIEVFQMRFLRIILKVRWDDVCEERIMNNSVRLKFFDIKNINKNS